LREQAEWEVSVVEDAATVRRAVSAVLEARGYRVHGFGDAESFLRDLDSHGAAGLRCLVLDIGLPGMSGLDLLRKLAARNGGRPAPPVIVFTFDALSVRGAALEAGASAVLEKTTDGIRELVASVAAVAGPPPREGAR
jgi:two-component system response regulator FixJ